MVSPESTVLRTLFAHDGYTFNRDDNAINETFFLIFLDGIMMTIEISSNDSRERERSSDLVFGAFLGLLLGIAGNLWVVLFDRLFITNYSHDWLVIIFLFTTGIGLFLTYLLYHLSRGSDIPLSFQDPGVIPYREADLGVELDDIKTSPLKEYNDEDNSENRVEQSKDSLDKDPNNCVH